VDDLTVELALELAKCGSIRGVSSAAIDVGVPRPPQESLLRIVSLLDWKELEADGVLAAVDDDGVAAVDGRIRKGMAACLLWVVVGAGDG
jgi:hypothetical protein